MSARPLVDPIAGVMLADPAVLELVLDAFLVGAESGATTATQAADAAVGAAVRSEAWRTTSPATAAARQRLRAAGRC